MAQEFAKLKDIFQHLDKYYKEKIFSNALIEHNTEKGKKTEEFWREFLKEYLPKRYTIDSGFIIDSENNISEQIDVIIYDRHFTPKFLTELSYYPVESVYAVFEVKQEFDKKNYYYSVKKFESVKKLKMTTGSFKDVSDDKKKFLEKHKVLGGIITEGMDSKIQFEKAQDLDILLSLDYGLRLRQNEAYKTFKKGILVHFVLGLIQALNKLGSCPAIEAAAYLRCIDS